MRPAVQIWCRPTAALDAAAIAAATAMLSDDERARCGRFRFASDARDYAAAHALLRTTLSRGTERPPRYWRFEATAAGKPVLCNGDAPVSFSLSHTSGMVACAITGGASVGVDVECLDREVNVDGIAARFFAASEAAHLARLDEAARRARFFDLWTLKEALAKGLGAGMALSLNRLAFTVGPDGVSVQASPEVDGSAWHFRLFTPAARHRLAVAVHASPAEAIRIELELVLGLSHKF